MLLLTLLATVTGAAPVSDALQMPPPPPGMREVASEEKRLMVDPLSAPVPPEGDEDDAEQGDEVEQESAELEELKALEEAALDPKARPSAEVLQTLRRLGVANPLRQRMLDALDQPTLREDSLPPELARITDLSSFDVGLVKDRYDIPVEMQPLVAQYVQFFQGPGRKWFTKWVSRSTRFLPLMQPILEKEGLPRDTVYLAMIESGFSTHAYSWAHAAGPWQFIASTGKQYGLKQDFWVDERRDPVKATRAAAAYLKQLYSELGHWYLAWAGYNTGSGRVKRVMSQKESKDFWVISDGKGLAKETKHYVPKLIAAALVAKHPQAFGFQPEEFRYEEVFSYDEVELQDATDLDVVARAAGVSVSAIQDLNPELKRWCTPPASAARPYKLRLPRGKAPQFAENFARIPASERLTFRVHTVKRGDTLSQIARRYGSAPEAILQVNRLKNARALRLNSDLVIPVAATKNGELAHSALERKVAQARRSGLVAARPEDEVPAGTRSRPLAAGPARTETVNGKSRVTYGVQSGDSLWTIASRFNVTVDELRQWNGLGKKSRGLQVGTPLFIYPRAGSPVEERSGTVIAHKAPPATPAARAAHGTKHALASGETLWSVSQRYGVSVEDLKRWNGIKDTRALRPGRLLTVAAP